MLDLTFLSEEELVGDEKLEVIKKIGPKAAVTDYSILLGCYVDNGYLDDEEKLPENKTATYWTRTYDPSFNLAGTIQHLGNFCYLDTDIRFFGLRPMVDYNEIEDLITNSRTNEKGILEVEYGEYPQMLADNVTAEELEKLYQKKVLIKTKKKYTHDITKWQDKYFGFSEKREVEYQYKKEKYIRFVATTNSHQLVLSNGETSEEGKAYWIKVEPVVWYVDEERDVAFTKKIILSGIQYNEMKKVSGGFNDTHIKLFMDKYLTKELECSALISYQTLVENKQTDLDQLFEETINKMNDINVLGKPKTLSLK